MSEYQWFEEEFTLADFSTVTDTTVTEDEYRTVERFEIPKGEVAQLGQGQANTQTDAVGRLFADIKDDADAAISGKVRFVIENTQNKPVRTISSHNTSTVNVGSNDRGSRRPYPLRPQQTAEPYKIAIQVQTASGTATYSSANSTVEVDGYRAEAVN